MAEVETDAGGVTRVPARSGPAALIEPRLAGLLAGLGTFLVSLVGITTPFGYDEAWAVGVAKGLPSPFADFGSGSSFANQPLYAVVEWAQIELTGNTSEVALRLVAILAFAVGVGLLTTAVAARLGTIPGVLAGAVTATSPLLFEFSRQARGYGFALLFSVASSVVVVDHLDDDRGPWRSWRIAYVLLAAAALACNVYLIVLVAVQAAYILGRAFEDRLPRLFPSGVRAADRPPSGGPPTARLRRWAIPVVLAALLGLAANITVLQGNLGSGGQGRVFRARWPATLAWFVVGRHPLLVLSGLAVVAAAVWAARRSWAFWAAAAVGGAFMAAIWLYGPVVLWPKYYLWLVPAFGLGVAVAASRWRAFVVVGVAIVAVQAFVSLRAAVQIPYAERGAASIVRTVESSGGRVCASKRSVAPLLAYLDRSPILVPERPTAEDLRSCDIVVTLDSGNEEAVRAVATTAFPSFEKLPAAVPGYVYYRSDRSCLFDRSQPSCWVRPS